MDADAAVVSPRRRAKWQWQRPIADPSDLRWKIYGTSIEHGGWFNGIL